MNKTELIRHIATAADLTQAEASDALNAVCAAIEVALKNGQDVQITGFGTFSVANRAERKGRNPKTGEPVLIPASRAVKFKAGKNLKDAV